MRPFVLALVALLPILPACKASPASEADVPVVLAIHGGAGTLRKDRMTPEQEAAYRAALETSLRAGHAVLAEGGSAMDAVVAAILPLEDSPLFNAGKGAVLTHDERCELDASVMDGASGGAGAVAGVTTLRNPILAARAVMTRSEHVMLSGAGAEAFAAAQGLATVPNAYFHTDRRVRQLREAKADDKHGTVGCVALDREGHLAAGTSTGGMTNKRWGRIGDSPIVGAGVWAEDATCAVSSTGWGEYFIRGAVAHDIAARMRYGGEGLVQAGTSVIHGTLTEAGGTGGVIALDRQGNVTAPFNTEGMYRGWIDRDGNVTIRIFR